MIYHECYTARVAGSRKGMFGALGPGAGLSRAPRAKLGHVFNYGAAVAGR